MCGIKPVTNIGDVNHAHTGRTPENEGALRSVRIPGRRKPFKKKEVQRMLSVAVISASGIPLMPTTSYRARKLKRDARFNAIHLTAFADA